MGLLSEEATATVVIRYQRRGLSFVRSPDGQFDIGLHFAFSNTRLRTH